MENTEKTTTENTTATNPNDDKVIAILSYLGILWVVAYVLYGSKKSEYNLFHIKQGLGVFITSIALWIIYMIFGMISSYLSYLIAPLLIAVSVIAILGVVNAANGEMKPLPLIGRYIEDALKNFK